MDDNQEDEGCVIRIRGLPWSASHENVQNFLEGVDIVGSRSGIHFTYVRDGRPSGEAYVELESEDDMEKALTKDKHHMGKRYIEVFRSKKSEMEWVVKRSGPNQPETGGGGGGGDAVIRLRGLPFGCSKEEIAHFFSGMEIVPNGITLLTDHQGRTTGDAYVQFANQDIADKALQKHKEKIGHRYIEIFKSSKSELHNAMSPRMRGPMGGGGMGGRPGPYDRVERFGGGGGGTGTGTGGGGGLGMGGAGGGGGGGGGMGYGGRGGRGRGNIKGYFDDGFGDEGFGGGYGGSGYGRGGSGGSGGGGSGGGGGGGMMGRRGGMGGGMGSGTGGGGGGGGGMGGSGGRGGGRFGNSGSGMSGGLGSGMGGGGNVPGKNHLSQTGHSVHMRGLPFAATEQDILDFFKPLNPVNVVLHYNDDGRASGEADVDYATHEEAKEAMKKDRSSMQHRYIELFLKSTVGGRQGGNFGGMGGNDGNYSSFDNGGNYGMGSGGMGGGGGGGGGGNGANSMNDNFGGNNYGGGYGNDNNSFGSGNMGGGYGGGMANMGNPNYTAF